MELKEAIEVLKERSEWIKKHLPESPHAKAIDTVVSHYEKSEKVDFLKSAKQPSEITHPYDLSKK